jgi:cyanophycin synthetase
VVGIVLDDALLAAWRARVERAGLHLGWVKRITVVRRHAGGVSLAMTAPIDQLFLATEVNEWALCAALLAAEPTRWQQLEAALAAEALKASAANAAAAADPPQLHEAAALARFTRLQALESNPTLRALLDAAATHALPYVLDESTLTLGAGDGGRSFSLDALPEVAAVAWQDLHGIPTAIVTGSNGKTTSVRLIAACARSQGWHAGYNCTDGVFLDGDALVEGDYSGPEGARRVMRETRAQAAVLETARGGILRRGIAVSQADVALVTNVSADHFGEYGIFDLPGLATVKLAVAGVLRRGGRLVLNADDNELRASAEALAERHGATISLGWFSAEPDSEPLRRYRAQGASTCGARDGRLYLHQGGVEHDLGMILNMPLSMQGAATYNVANIAGAALAAAGLGIEPAVIAGVLAHFGSGLKDNPGRMMRFEVGGVRVLIDYAHNPDGLRGFLHVAEQVRSARGRLGLLLGHAGNRTDTDIRALAQAAAAFRPDYIVLKENESQLRGRAPGEVPTILRNELKRLGFPEAAMRTADSEIEGARRALDWAVAGDLLAMPLHSLRARNAVMALLGAADCGPVKES